MKMGHEWSIEIDRKKEIKYKIALNNEQFNEYVELNFATNTYRQFM